MKRRPRITHIDCFAGAGGLCTGFHAAGIETVLAIEKVESCAETYRANHQNVHVIVNDIRKVKNREILKYVNGSCDIVTAGMPCETFSTAGATSRSFYDDRQFLFTEAIRIAKVTEARLILFENVPGITSKKTHRDGTRLVIEEIFDALAANGYHWYVDTILDAADFGVPQHRDRFFILASRDESLALRVPIARHERRVSVREALADIPSVEANSGKEVTSYKKTGSAYSELMRDARFWKIKESNGHNLTYHIPPNHRAGTIERFKLVKPGEGLRDLFEKLSSSAVKELQERRVLPNRWYIQRNRRPREDTPCVTITSHCLDEIIHPTENRSLTVREVARLQSFPDSYDFKGGPMLCPHIYETQDKYEQIGDAVPPLLAYEWGEVIKNILRKQS